MFKVMASLLLTLNIFDNIFIVSIFDFGQVNVYWVSLYLLTDM